MRVGRASAPGPRCGALVSRFVSPIPPGSCRNKEQWRTVAARIDRHCSRLGASSSRTARVVLTPSRDKGIAGGPFEYQPDAHRSPKEDDCSTDFPARRLSIHGRALAVAGLTCRYRYRRGIVLGASAPAAAGLFLYRPTTPARNRRR